VSSKNDIDAQAKKKKFSSKQNYFAFRNSIKEKKSSEKDDDKQDLGSKKTDRNYYWKKYREWLWPYKIPLGLIFLMALVGMLLEMVLPWATKYIIDSILLSDSMPTEVKYRQLNWIGGGVLLTLMFGEFLGALRTNRMTVLNSQVVFSLRKSLFNRLIQMPLSYINDTKSGGIVSRLSSDVENVTGLVQMAFISPGVAIIKVFVTLGILFSIRWELALAAAALLPVLTYLSILWVKKARPVYKSMADDRSQIDARVAETFSGIRVVRSFRGERKEKLDYAIGHHAIIRKKIFADMIEIIVGTGWSFIIPLVGLIIVWLGGSLFIKGSASIGDIVAFQMYTTMLLYPVWRIILSLSQTQRALASMEKVFDIMDRPLDLPDAVDAVTAPSKVRSVEARHVGFSYKADLPVLKDISFNIKGGSVVAFVGPSGAGKTTLTDVIARFFDPSEGSILVNGIDVKQFSRNSYRKLFGIVQQDVFLFDGTVEENIAYGNRRAKKEVVINAAQRANADEFIRDLPNKYDTLIGERGVKLSGGQRQRISIARAILANPEILILDEATSNLDTESEQKIQAAIKELFKGRTTFVIAHRLSTITSADLIIVLDKGVILESGTHEQLIGLRGFYFAMVERQRESLKL
jgi:ATP-binding cassette subfamily B protein/subfamily B ATP-binding cassette protein MsbA